MANGHSNRFIRSIAKKKNKAKKKKTEETTIKTGEIPVTIRKNQSLSKIISYSKIAV